MIASLCWIITITVLWLTGNQLFVGSDEDIALFIQFFLTLIPLILSIVALFLLAAAHGFSTIAGKIWVLLGFGLTWWFVGDFVYAYFEYKGQLQFPSIADMFYIIGYVPITIGLMFQMFQLNIKLHHREKILSFICIILVTALIGFFVLYPTIAKMALTGVSALAQIEGALYPVADIILLSIVIIVFGKLYHGKINVAWILILLGLATITFADCLYLVSYSQGDNYLFNIYDLAFIISYILILVGSLKLISIMMTIFEKPKEVKD